MTSLQDALTEALEHPREYHPQRPRPLQKKVHRQSAGTLPFLWGIVTSLAAAGLILRFFRHRSA